MTDYRADPDRRHYPETGIPVRALDGDRWSDVDIAHLRKESLLAWLRSRGGDNSWAESVVLLLLGHELTPTVWVDWDKADGTPVVGGAH